MPWLPMRAKWPRPARVNSPSELKQLPKQVWRLTELTPQQEPTPQQDPKPQQELRPRQESKPLRDPARGSPKLK
jgi:hypothetical protein